MYKFRKTRKTQLSVNFSELGETIEQKVARIVVNKEPIRDGAPLTYTEKEKGVMDEYNPRADRWEIAAEAMNIVHKQKMAKGSQMSLGKDESQDETKKQDESKNSDEKANES